MRETIARWFPITRDWGLEKWLALPLALLILAAGANGLAREAFDALGWFHITDG